MQRKQLTDQLVTQLTAKRKRYVVYDSMITSLGVRVSPKGKKTFSVVGRFNGNKHPTRRKIGDARKLTIEQARERALKFDARPSDKFGDVAERFFEHIKRQRRAEEVERCIRRDLLPRWETKAIGSISKQDVREVIDALKARGKLGAAQHVLSYAKRLFNFAVDRDLIEHSPCERVKAKALIGERAPRQRVLNDDELKAVWQAANRAGAFGKLTQLLLLTGTRRSEASFARPEEIDTKRKLWTIPPERFKSNTTHVVPLSQLALGIATHVPFHVTGFSKSKKRLDVFMLAELRKLNPKAKLTHWTLHDLRRTVRTRLSAITTYEVAELVIGHGKKGLARVYDQHEYLDEMRKALDAWAKRLAQITSDTKAKSVHNAQTSEHNLEDRA